MVNSVVLVSFYQLEAARFTIKKEFQMRKCFQQIACGQIYLTFSWLVNDIGDPFPRAGIATPGQVVLDVIGKKAEQAIGSKLESSIPP